MSNLDVDKYKLSIYPALEAGNIGINFTFATRKEMASAQSSCASLLLFIQDDLSAMKDFSNMFICQELVGGEWEEIDDEI